MQVRYLLGMIHGVQIFGDRQDLHMKQLINNDKESSLYDK